MMRLQEHCCMQIFLNIIRGKKDAGIDEYTLKCDCNVYGLRVGHPDVLQVQAVGRVYSVSHHNVELFALRRLLSIVKGAVSFEDLATVNGFAYPTFREACKARGMLADDAEIMAAMQEIVDTTVSVSAIRRQFVMLLLHSAPVDPQALFQYFVEDLCEAADGADAVNVALLEMESEMQEHRRSLADAEFGFVLPDDRNMQRSVRRRRVSLTADSAAAAAQMRDQLVPLFTDEQHAAMRLILNAIDEDHDSKLFGLLASAGVGKTLFANGLAAHLRSENRSVLCVAASGLAAILLSEGRTAHSALKIPIPANEMSMCNFTSAERAAIRQTSLIIYDECSMVHSDIADTVDRSLRDVMHDDRHFGGKAVLFMGDFKQLLPVVRYGSGHNCTIQRCKWWPSLQLLAFTKNWRAACNPDYTAFLEEVGNGRMEIITPPPECRVSNYTELIDAVYGTTWENTHQILALTLETCAAVNDLCFDKLPGNLTCMPASDSYVDCRDPDDFPPEYIESLDMKGAPPWLLKFKLGAKYMCIRNLDLKRGIVNGTLLKLLSIGRHTAQFQILTGKASGSVDIFTRAVFTITPEASGLPFTVIRTQFPIIPAYCLSVHKAQGQSLQCVGLIFESDPFTHGQLYVALSRVAGWHKVFTMFQGDNIKNHVLRHLLQAVYGLQ